MRQFIVAGAVVLLIFISVIWFFARSGDKPKQQVGVNRETNITNYADTNTVVRFTQEGKINAREEHRVLQITIGQTERTAVIYDGYQGNVLKSQTLLNDRDAYKAFLAGLQNSGFTKPKVATRNVVPLGACPNGKRYHYDIINGSDTKQSLWSTSCNSARGTFGGNVSNVQTLFQNQIPDYSTFIQGVSF
ncbi:MAG: hypothetical protein H6793_01365 [Candidatus Nomurabacteria bacterium]|nr:hypothetical protein [Candidatus Saccharibacteria bacterium]USN95793.1 MAG: hypothetical protein H6793_01365 [Candidatus Nomurabacteria bacterium]